MAFLNFLCLFVAIFLISDCSGRIHRLRVEDDVRQEIDLSTFGFLRGGYMVINVTGFQFENIGPSDQLFGFTLDKTVSTGISPYLESKRAECVLKDKSLPKDSSVSLIMFTMDFQNLRLNISRQGRDLQNLNISLLTENEFSSSNKRKFRNSDLSDQSLMRSRHRLRREAVQSTTAGLTTTPPTLNISTVKDEKTSSVERRGHSSTTLSPTPLHNTPVPGVTVKVAPPSGNNGNSTKEVKNRLVPVNGSVQMKKDDMGAYSFYLLLMIQAPQEEGLYNLFFHNCHNFRSPGLKIRVNFTVELVEKNNNNYLSAGEMPLPLLYLVFCLVYLAAALLWLYVIRTSADGVFKIHYLMLVLTFVKSIASFFHAINTYFIQREGHHEEAFAILYYITHLMKGALLFVTLVLVGAGWAFVKHILSERDKKIFIFVIPLQVLANVAQIIIEETEEGQLQYTTWKEIFILVDLLCCGMILLPVVWSIRLLQEASQTDGKAAINLKKLKIFRHFYILIVCYIYFTRIIVYLLSITVPFQYVWLDDLSRETATLVFFIVTGYKFRPASNNPYLQLATDDEEEMDEVVTEIGAYENLKKVNNRSGNKDGSTQLAKREASLEYD